MRIPKPNYTQTPNDLFDYWLPRLSEGELKVLLVIMRKTFGWHKQRDRISNSQLAKITGLTEETIRISAKSLCEKGVITREVVGLNGSQQTYYEVVVCEDSNNYDRADEQGGPGGINPGVYSAPQKKDIYKKETTTKEKPPAAVILKKDQETTNPMPPPQPIANRDQSSANSGQIKIYDCLKDVDIDFKEKQEISGRYSEGIVKNAVDYATHPETKITKGMVQAIKWACKESPQVPKKQKDEIEDNRKAATELIKRISIKPSHVNIEILNQKIEIVFLGCSKEPDELDFSSKGFVQQLESKLRKAGCHFK